MFPKQSVTNIFEYSNILGTNIYSDIHSGQFCLYEYIRTFVRVKFVCTNIFRHSFMSVLESENRPNIRIFVQFSIRIFIRTFVRVKFVIRIYSDIQTLLHSIYEENDVQVWKLKFKKKKSFKLSEFTSRYSRYAGFLTSCCLVVGWTNALHCDGWPSLVLNVT